MASASLSRVGFVGGLFTVASVVAWGSLLACESLSTTSPLPSGDASDLDSGFIAFPVDEASAPASTVDAGQPPASGRIRLANLLQGPKSVDLCARRDEPGAPWEPNKVTSNPFITADTSQGLLFGEVSQHTFLAAATNPDGGSAPGTKYLFRIVPIGSPCDGDGGVTLAQITPSVTLRPGGGFTLVAVGIIDPSVDAGDAFPRGIALSDNVAPPATASLLRVFHGVPDLPAFDVVVNGETVLTGIKYASAVGFPYATSNTAGFANIAAGVPAEATLTLRAGTTVRSFTIPARLRRGIASSVFVAGKVDDLDVSLCADRTAEADQPLSTCVKLKPQD